MTTKPFIVDDMGRCQFGRFTMPFISANIAESHLNDSPFWLQKPTPWNAKLRSLRLKEWHFISINHPDLFLAFAVAQLGYVANLFVYVFDKRNGRIHQWGDRVLLGRGLTFGASSIQGDTVWQSRTCFLKINNHERAWNIDLNTSSLSTKLSIERDEAMALVYPLTPNRPGYTHKEAGNRVNGRLQLEGEEFRLTPENSFAASDWTRSFSNQVTEWLFACFAAKSEDGTRVGINLSQLIYGSQENTLWIDGKSHSTGEVVFDLPEAGQLDSKIWKMNTEDGMVRLQFTPLGARREHVTIGLLASKFTQVFGTYAGTLTVNQRSYRFDGAFGVAEKHYSKW